MSSEHVVSRNALDNGVVVTVRYDPDPCSPREHTNLGNMWLSHPRYAFSENGGDRNLNPEDFETVDQLLDEIRKHNPHCILPVFMYEHGFVSLRAGYVDSLVGPFDDPGGWDTSMIGFIFDSQNSRDETGVSEFHIKSVLRNEVQEYGKYLNGEVFQYEVTFRDRVIECVGGFYISDDAIDEGLSSGQDIVDEIEKNSTLLQQTNELRDISKNALALAESIEDGVIERLV